MIAEPVRSFTICLGREEIGRERMVQEILSKQQTSVVLE